MTIFVIIIFVLTFIVMGFVFATMFSPKLRGKMLANQIKATIQPKTIFSPSKKCRAKAIIDKISPNR